MTVWASRSLVFQQHNSIASGFRFFITDSWSASFREKAPNGGVRDGYFAKQRQFKGDSLTRTSLSIRRIYSTTTFFGNTGTAAFERRGPTHFVFEAQQQGHRSG